MQVAVAPPFPETGPGGRVRGGGRLGGGRERGSRHSGLRASQTMVCSALCADRAWSGPEMMICFEGRVCRGEPRTLLKVRGGGRDGERTER